MNRSCSRCKEKYQPTLQICVKLLYLLFSILEPIVCRVVESALNAVHEEGAVKISSSVEGGMDAECNGSGLPVRECAHDWLQDTAKWLGRQAGGTRLIVKPQHLFDGWMRRQMSH